MLLVPERLLFIARLDGIIVGCAQLVRPPRNNEAQAFAATLMHSFVAPYARGHGLARLMTRRVEDAARALGFQMLNLDVRETQAAAIKLYESARLPALGRAPGLCAGGWQDDPRPVLLQAVAGREIAMADALGTRCGRRCGTAAAPMVLSDPQLPDCPMVAVNPAFEA